jgi:hypothetical protein
MARSYNSTLVSLSLISLLQTAQNKAAAYPTPVDFSGVLMAWDRSPESPVVKVRAISTFESSYDDYLRDDLASAMELWSSVDSSFLQLEITEEQDEDILVYFEEASKHEADSSGYAIFDKLNNDGSPSHCEVRIDATSLDFKKTMLHEMGHCLGLGHSLIPESIMSYRGDINNFELDVDDQAAIARLYPADGSDPKLPQGCSVSSRQEDINNSSRSSLIVFFMILLVTALPFPRKKRAPLRGALSK